MIDGILLQSLEGLEEAPLVPPGSEIWEWLRAEKEAVVRETLSEGPLCQTGVSGMQGAEGSEEIPREIEWRHRGQLETPLWEISEAQARS